jgi:uncharacterized iron-regulated membrane protein
VSGNEIAQPLSLYVERARQALGSEAQISSLRLPGEEGGPVVVSARLPGEGRPRLLSAWLDPPTARLLDAGDAGSPLLQAMHRLHGSLMLPGYGRQIAGWLGVALTISALTGLWLWWPHGGRLATGLRWRRGLTTSANLHRILGAWIALPLAVVTLTGVWISFPQAARSLVAMAAPTRSQPPQQQRRPNFAMPLTAPIMAPQTALETARAELPDSGPITLGWPTEAARSWRVQRGNGSGATIVLVGDASGEARLQPPLVEPSSADAIARLMRRVHDGNDMGIVWQAVVFLTGVLPALFAVTGLMMWLRRRRAARVRRLVVSTRRVLG